MTRRQIECETLAVGMLNRKGSGTGGGDGEFVDGSPEGVALGAIAVEALACAAGSERAPLRRLRVAAKRERGRCLRGGFVVGALNRKLKGERKIFCAP